MGPDDPGVCESDVRLGPLEGDAASSWGRAPTWLEGPTGPFQPLGLDVSFLSQD